MRYRSAVERLFTGQRNMTPGSAVGSTSMVAPASKPLMDLHTLGPSYVPLSPWGVQGDASVPAPWYGVYTDAAAAVAKTGPVIEMGITDAKSGFHVAADATLGTGGYFDLFAWGTGTEGAGLYLNSPSGGGAYMVIDDSLGHPAGQAGLTADTAAAIAMWAEHDGATNRAWIDMTENSSDPSAPGFADRGRIFMRDNGGGKTQMCVRFHTGAVQVLATEP